MDLFLESLFCTSDLSILLPILRYLNYTDLYGLKIR